MNSEHSAAKQRVGELILLACTAVWGTTFVAVQDVLVSWPPFYLIAARFGLATVMLAPWLAVTIIRSGPRRRASAQRPPEPPNHGAPAAAHPLPPGGERAFLSPGPAMTWMHVRQGVILGTMLFAGFALQTMSLVYTTPARSAFGTALVTVLVPLFGFVFLRWRWSAGTYLALGSAAAGILLLFGRQAGQGAVDAATRPGDLMALSCAAAFALQILLLTHFSRSAPVLPLVTVELGTTTVWSLVAAAVSGEAAPAPPWLAWQGLLYLGLLATGVCLFAQVYGQSRTTANRAAFIYALESPCAALFGWLWNGDVLKAHELIGGLLITAAALSADRPLPSWLRWRQPKTARR